MYKVRYRKQVVKFLQQQDRNLAKKIVDIFDHLKYDPFDFRHYDIKKMQGMEQLYRLRVSKYRILFSIDNETVTIEVVRAKSRGDVYKQ